MINLYRNPTDTTRLDYFSYGPTVRSYEYAEMSDGSVRYKVGVNRLGEDMDLWLVYESDIQVTENYTYYSITYNANGGSGAPAAQTKIEGETLTLSTVKPTRDGYTFLGWAESSSATTAKYQSGGSFSKEGNYTLYAVWKKNNDDYVLVSASGTDLRVYTPTHTVVGNTGAKSDNPNFSALDMRDAPDSVLITEFGASSCEGLEIYYALFKNTVTSIGEFAFRNTKLKYLSLPSSVKSIDQQAFSYCDLLTTAVLPDSITYLGPAAFYMDKKLSEVNIPKGINTLQYSTFAYTAITSVEVPNSVTRIEDTVFKGCSQLKTITLPSSITYIGDGAFSGCANITRVQYSGTVSDWQSTVAFGSNNENLLNSPIYCSDGKINCLEWDKNNLAVEYEQGTRPDFSTTAYSPVRDITEIYAVIRDNTSTASDLFSSETIYPNAKNYVFDKASPIYQSIPFETLAKGTYLLYVYAEIPGIRYTQKIQLTVTEPKSTLFFSANGGSGTMPSQSVSKGNAFTLPSCTFTAPAGKQFKAWNINGTEYAVGASYTVSGDVTITAVWKTATVPVTGVSLNKTALTLTAGASETLTATVSPSNATNKNVTWTTSNSSIATVSNGTVSAVGAGTATITVTTVDGGKTATCAVTVASEPVDPNAPVVRVGDATVTSGNTFTVPVEFLNNPGITGFSLELSYDKKYLELTSVADGEFTGLTKSKEITENPYVIVWNHGTADQTGTTAATLTFRAKDGVEGTTQIQVAFRNGEKPWNVMDDTIPFTAKSGTVTIRNYIPGDANGDGVVSGRDATRVVQHVAGWNVTIDVNAADANGDGTVSGRDATRIVQYVAGWNVTLGQTTPKLMSLLGSAPSNQRLVVGNGSAAPGDTVTIPVMFQNNPGITGFSIEIDYDDTALELIAARSGDFDGLTTSPAIGTKPYRVVWNHGTEDKTGSVAVELDFRVKDGASGSATVSCAYISGEKPWNVSDDSVDFELVSGTVTIGSAAALNVIGINGTTMTWHTDLNGAGKTLNAIAAWYDTNGRLIGTSVKPVTVTGSIGNQTISVGANAAEYRLFLLDGNSCPVVENWKSK